MKKLIISLDPYTWAVELAGTIMRDPKSFDFIILYIDDTTPIFRYKNLCRDAVFVQRRHDLFRLGKEVGLKKVINLDLNKESLNVEKLVIQLQLYIGRSGIQEIWYQDDPILYNILVPMCRILKLEKRAFGMDYTPYDLTMLSDIEWKNKKKLLSLMIGIDGEQPVCKNYEVAYE